MILLALTPALLVVLAAYGISALLLHVATTLGVIDARPSNFGMQLPALRAVVDPERHAYSDDSCGLRPNQRRMRT